MKSTKHTLYSFIIFIMLAACENQQKETTPVTTIAFGSCSSENNPLPIFDLVVEHKPDLFIFLGDNIYGDTKNIDTLKTKYQRLANKSSFQNLKKTDLIQSYFHEFETISNNRISC